MNQGPNSIETAFGFPGGVPGDPAVFLPGSARLSDAPAAPPSVSIASDGARPETHVIEETDWIEWIQLLVAADARSSAIESLAAQLTRYFGVSSVRIASGRAKIRRVYDHRMGWLTRESDLWRNSRELWELNPFDGEWLDQSEEVLSIGLRLSEEVDERCLIWLERPRQLTRSRDALSAPLKSMAMLIQRLPARKMTWMGLLFGRYPMRSIVALTMIATAILCFPVPYPVACVAKAEPVGERLVAAPFNAMLASCLVKPGDVVSVDQVLLVLDDKPLKLERESVYAELERAKKEREVALASHKIADAQQAELKQRRLDRQIQLLDTRLASLQVRSPIDGMIISGDLDRLTGAPLELGQALLEIAPLNQLSIELEIPEFEIGYIQEDSETRVRFPAAGGESIYSLLKWVSPAAEVRDDQNVFVAKFDYDNDENAVRPGMKGKAAAYGPLRPLCWRFVRSTYEQLLWWVGY